MRRPVVAKLIHYRTSAIPSKVLAEANAHFAVDHPNIVKALDVICDTTHSAISIFTLCLFLEYAEGGDLEKIVRACVGLPEAIVKPLYYQLLDAISYLHRQGLIHGDLKPSNLVLDGRGNLLVTDLQFTRPYRNNNGEELRLHLRTGTQAYMAPEVCHSNSRIYNLPLTVIGSDGCAGTSARSSHRDLVSWSNPDLCHHW